MELASYVNHFLDCNQDFLLETNALTDKLVQKNEIYSKNQAKKVFKVLQI